MSFFRFMWCVATRDRLAFILLLPAFATMPVLAAGYADNAQVKTFIAEMVNKHQFKAQDLEALFSMVNKQQGIIDAISKPAEREFEWKDYRKIFMNAERIDGGRQFIQDNKALLLKAEEKWGVSHQVIAAILGVETRYGQRKGTHTVVESLATLAFDYPSRSKFFRSELEQLLLLGREQGMNLLDIKGSYAGAIGYGQFIPSSYRHYAVDFDGDGKADLINSVADAIGSIANYLARHGWQKNKMIAWQVFPSAIPSTGQLPGKQKPVHKLGDFAALKLDTRGLDAKTPARLMAMQGESGKEYWMGLQNFYVITRYNHSDMYALAVMQLSEAIGHP